MRRDIANSVNRKKNTCRFRKQKSDKTLEEYRSRKKQTKRDHEISLTLRIKENPKAFYMFMQSKRKGRFTQGQ